MENRTWFKQKHFLALRITEYTNISNPHVERTLLIKDNIIIQHFVDVIESIPSKGDMMISFGPGAEHIDLSFENGDHVEKIHFYQKKIKTPSTGFNSLKSQVEIDLYNEVAALLASA